MATVNFTQPTYATNNNQAQPDQPTLSATQFKLLLDQVGIDTKAFLIDDLITELEENTLGSSGANRIGCNAVGVTALNVNDAIAEVQANIAGAVVGEIPNNSLTEAKMAAEMKKQAGGVYPYDSGDTNATNIATNTADVELLEIAVDARDTTGSANAYILDTDGNVDYTKDGRPVTFIPNFSNTGASTINIDGQGTKTLLKPDGAGGTTALVEGDIIDGTPVTIYRRVSGDFFLLAPKGGSAIKSIQHGLTSFNAGTTFKDVNITAIDLNTSYVYATYNYSGTSTDLDFQKQNAKIYFLDADTIRIEFDGVGPAASNDPFEVKYTVVEYNSNVIKSLQSGETTLSVGTTNVSVTSVEKNKSFLVFSLATTGSNNAGTALMVSGYINTNTQISFETPGLDLVEKVRWFLIEFK